MKKKRLLDLCCGGGGAAMGYHRAGFEVVGVDIAPQPKYPFEFIQADALEYLAEHGDEYDFIHSSPPCQGYSRLRFLHGKSYPDLIQPTRELLIATGKPYVIENTPDAPLINPLMLCGTMFGLLVIRHRIFETNPIVYFAPASCRHVRKVCKSGRKPDRGTNYITVVGHFSDVEFGRVAMGIDWLGQKGLAQAIPPAYTEWLVKQMMRLI